MIMISVIINITVY